MKQAANEQLFLWRPDHACCIFFFPENKLEITVMPLYLREKWIEIPNGLSEDNSKYQFVIFFYLGI